MNALPSSSRMAEIVTGVTKTMLGLSFIPDSSPNPWSSLVWRTAVLPIPGDRPLTVGLSSDERGCATLSAAMFACAPDSVDAAMMNDALCELVNMTAGLLKSHMALNQALGLPRIVHGSDAPYMKPSDGRHVLVLRAQDVGLVLWIVEGLA
jgi:hypothetical protein